MNNWIMIFLKEDSTLPEGMPTSIRINKDNLLYFSLYDNRMVFDFIDGSSKVFYFKDWDIAL